MILPESKFLRFDKIVPLKNVIEIDMSSFQDFSICPECNQASYRIHSNYQRNPKDLPWANTSVFLHLNVRRFFCDNSSCKYKIFTERLPDLILPYSRNTDRLLNLLRVIAFANGGEEGSKILKEMGINVSADTLIRIIRNTPETIMKIPEVVGIDDWAFRKGTKYGTIIVNNETGKPIELLPDRKTETVEVWLKSHPGIKYITRDRARFYKKAIDNEAPNTIQIADRWHLIKNLTEAVQLLLLRKNNILIQTAKSFFAKKIDSEVTESLNIEEIKSKADKERIFRRERRLKRFNKVKELFSQGFTQREIKKEIGVNFNTIRRYLSFEELPEILRPSILAKFRPYLEKRWNEGCHNTKELWKEICLQGFHGAYTTVKYFIKPRSRKKGKVISYSSYSKEYLKTPKETAFIIQKEEKDLQEKDKEFRNKLFELFPDILRVSEIVKEFKHILKEKDIKGFSNCVEKMMKSEKEICSFANGLKTDWEAVKSAVCLKWSNGKTEGNVNRLKLIKRKMYGRAKFDLLRLRVLHSY